MPHFSAAEFLFFFFFKMIKPGMPIVLFHSGVNGMSRVSRIYHSTFTECCMLHMLHNVPEYCTLDPLYGI